MLKPSQSPFENWYTYSTVHKPLSDFTCETGLVFFPPELVPGVGHPLVDKLGNHATRRLTMRKLESYNAFTEKLEYKAVFASSRADGPLKTAVPIETASAQRTRDNQS
jgi:hypothetical protein